MKNIRFNYYMLVKYLVDLKFKLVILFIIQIKSYTN